MEDIFKKIELSGPILTKCQVDARENAMIFA